MNARERRVLVSGLLWFVGLLTANALVLVVGVAGVVIALALPDETPREDARRRNGIGRWSR